MKAVYNLPVKGSYGNGLRKENFA